MQVSPNKYDKLNPEMLSSAHQLLDVSLLVLFFFSDIIQSQNLLSESIINLLPHIYSHQGVSQHLHCQPWTF